MMPIEIEHNFKFIVVGSASVGKTSILRRLIENQFTSENVSPTIGAEYTTYAMDIGNCPVKLQIFDTAGQDRYKSIAKSYFRHAVGVALVFDITVRRSFDDLSQWLIDIHSLCDQNCVIILIGNKIDNAAKRVVTTAEATEFASKHNLMYIETSAKGGDNVQEAFTRAAKAVYDLAEGGQLDSKEVSSITKNIDQSKASGCVCSKK